MPEIKVKIVWDKPDDQVGWLCPDNIKYCLTSTCLNSKFKVDYLLPERIVRELKGRLLLAKWLIINKIGGMWKWLKDLRVNLRKE